jgi:hypothetical protein
LGIDRKRAQRLMRLVGLEAIYPKPHLSRNNAEHRSCPYLLRNVAIVRAVGVTHPFPVSEPEAHRKQG